jgi:vacuolar-type H+-ATPase subunit F/Vma7
MTMGRVAALGERARVAGLALAGAVVIVADDPEAVRRGWRSLPDDVDLVILTPAAAEALEQGPRAEALEHGPTVAVGRRRLTTVMPP